MGREDTEIEDNGISVENFEMVEDTNVGYGSLGDDRCLQSEGDGVEGGGGADVVNVGEIENIVEGGCASKGCLDDATGDDAERIVSSEAEVDVSSEDILIKDLLKRRSKKNRKWRRKKSKLVEDLSGKKKGKSGKKRQLKGNVSKMKSQLYDKEVSDDDILKRIKDPRKQAEDIWNLACDLNFIDPQDKKENFLKRAEVVVSRDLNIQA